MFSAYCPRHRATMLFSTSSIESMTTTPLGIEVVVRCYCGERLEVLTGRPASEHDETLEPVA
jgi:hypothetical protein